MQTRWWIAAAAAAGIGTAAAAHTAERIRTRALREAARSVAPIAEQAGVWAPVEPVIGGAIALPSRVAEALAAARAAGLSETDEPWRPPDRNDTGTPANARR